MNWSWVIPSYEKTDILITCIESIRKFYPTDEIIISDDGSKKILKDLKEIAKKYNCKLLLNFWNNGFGYTANRGLNSATNEYVCLINNDVELTQDIKQETERVFNSDNKIGLIGYLLYYPNGNIQHAGHKFVDYKILGHHEHGFNPKQAKLAYISRYEAGVTGALMTFRKSMLNEIGGFKSGYGLAFEDVELCLRSWYCGWRVYYIASVSAIHKEGVTRGATTEDKIKLGFMKAEQKSAEQYAKDIKIYTIKEILENVENCNKSNITYYKNVCVKRTAALGDCIMATGIIEALKNKHNDIDIIVCTDNEYAFKNNPNVTKIVKSIEQYSGYKLIDLDMCYEKEPKKPVWKAYADHALETYEDKDILPKLYDNKIDIDNATGKLRRLGIKDNFIVINPSCSWESRTLPKYVWNEFLESIKEQVLILGTHKDQTLNEYSHVKDLRDYFTIGEVRHVIKKAKCFIGIDSGLFHVAQTTETPIVSIFSCVNPEYRVWRKEKTQLIVPNSMCKFCLHDNNGEVVAKSTLVCKHGDNRCINSITIKDLLEAYNNAIE